MTFDNFLALVAIFFAKSLLSKTALSFSANFFGSPDLNIKQFSQNSMRPLNERTCKHKDCKAVQERLERTLRSIIDLVNHSLQPN